MGRMIRSGMGPGLDFNPTFHITLRYRHEESRWFGVGCNTIYFHLNPCILRPLRVGDTEINVVEVTIETPPEQALSCSRKLYRVICAIHMRTVRGKAYLEHHTSRDHLEDFTPGFLSRRLLMASGNGGMNPSSCMRISDRLEKQHEKSMIAHSKHRDCL